MTKVLFPGSFNPPTLGHIELIRRASKLFTKVYVGIIAHNNKNTSLIDSNVRLNLLTTCVTQLKNVEIIIYDGLTVTCAEKLEVNFLIRGLRASEDFNFEFQLASSNSILTNIETLFLAASPLYSHISGTVVRDIARNGHRLHGFVPDEIENTVFDLLKSH